MTRATLRAAGATDVGRKRSVNEDRLFVDAARGVFVVVDGVGGHAAGDTAADTAIAILSRELTRNDGTPTTTRLTRAITQANNEIHRLAGTRPDWHGMACVLTAAVVTGDRVAVGHVGDSRLYRLIDGRLEKVTPDHSPIGAREDARELSELEAMRHPRRNEVFRDVGSERHDATDADFIFVTEIDYPEGAALLLCSDGLTDLVPSGTIRQIALTHAGSPDAVAKALVAAANDAGGKDNVTVIYVERGAGARAERPAQLRESRGDPERLHAKAERIGPASTARTIALVGLAAVIGFVAGFLTPDGGWLPKRPASILGSSVPGVVVVRTNESIASAIEQATPGTTVLVEPGEYRERLTLRDNIRVVSREPRGATLRLPGTAAEGDAAVLAVGVANAELSGFRIVGDAATPLGVGVIVRDASVRLTDLEISGASSNAIDLGAGDGVMLSASRIHNNPGAALVVRSGATPRIANNVFRANATSERSFVPFVLEAGSAASWTGNVFDGMTSLVLPGLDAAARERIAANNWFVAPSPAPIPAPTGRRGSRGGRSQ